MKIGMFTSGYALWPLEQCFRDAREFGYDYIELYGARPHAYAQDLLDGDAARVRALMEQYEIPVPVYTPEHNLYPYNYMLGSEAQRRDAVDYLCRCLDAARLIGAGQMLTSPAFGAVGATSGELWERLIKTMRELVEYAEKVQVQIIVETLTPYESNFFTRANDLAELFEAVDSPWIAGVCDVIPPYVQQESILSYFDKLGPKMVHLHLVDGRFGTDDHLVPGEGTIPLEELMSELDRRGCTCTATIELVGKYGNEPGLYARRAINRVRAMEKEAGKPKRRQV